MTTYNKLAVAIGLVSGVMMASQAQAFNNVDWNWDGYVNTDVNIDVYIDPKIKDPGGLVMVESLQKQIGDVSSEAIVSDVSYGAGEAGDPSIELVDSLSAGSSASSAAMHTAGIIIQQPMRVQMQLQTLTLMSMSISAMPAPRLILTLLA
jgi:hypothetical protein